MTDPNLTHGDWAAHMARETVAHNERTAALAAEASTQARFPWQAAIRTAIQVLLSALTVLAVAIPLAIEHLGAVIGPEVVAWLGGALAVVTAVSTFLARLMAAAPVIEFTARFLPWLAPTKQ